MCTLTYFNQGGGYQVFFNRDERRTRKSGLVPAVRRCGDTSFIAPLDGDHGGTWVAVSEHGLCLCLLNGFISPGAPPAVEAGDFTSRGFLATALIDSERSGDALERLESFDLTRYRPFMLAMFAPDEATVLARWNGTRLGVDEVAPDAQPLVSSSFYTEKVRASRAAVFEQTVTAAPQEDRAAAHLAYHRSHRPARGPYSPCMHREDARTVSFSWVKVDGESVRFRYTPDSPCRAAADGPPLTLDRR